MKYGIRIKLFALFMALVTGCLVAHFFLFVGRFDEALLRFTTEELKTHLRYTTDMLLRCGVSCDVEQGLREQVDKAAHLGGDRVTLVHADGTVWMDSGRASVVDVANHLNRPEIRMAMQEPYGMGLRWSETVQEKMLYVAQRVDVGVHKNVFVRVAVPVKAVKKNLKEFTQVMWVSVVCVFGVAVLASFAVSYWISKKVKKLTDKAQQMASGDLSVRTETLGRNEFSTLGHALNQLAEGFQKALHSLKGERDLMDGVLQNMREGVLLFDDAQTLVLGNAALCGMLDIEKNCAGKPLFELIDHPGLVVFLQKSMHSQHVRSMEVEIEKKHVARRMMVYVTVLDKTSGLALAVFVDVTELRRLESLRKDFVANASHELRTPVAIVRSAAETLPCVVDVNPKITHELIDVIGRNAERLHRLVDDLLDLSRIESKGIGVRKEYVDVAQIVCHVTGLFTEKVKEREISVQCEIPEGLPSLYVDRYSMEQVISNLFDNAIKYSGKHASVKITAHMQEGWMHMHVKDTGPGIEAVHIPRLFERFYRVDKGRSRELGGTGLGLSIVKHLVEAMGGDVQVESRAGSGSCFSFTVPVQGV